MAKPEKKQEAKEVKKAPGGMDRIFGYDAEHIEVLEKERPWEKNPKHYQNCTISALASMKMLKHALSGVHQGQKDGGLSNEVMGLLIGKPNGDTIVVMDSVPLPIKGEANFVEAGPQISQLQIALMESMEERRQESFIGWYHSHPFDVTTHSNAFLSNTDVQSQTAFQLSMPNWVAIVVDPLRSLAKQKPDFGCFRAYPPSYDGPQGVAPDGSPVVDKEATTARWGVTYHRYYQLKTTYFMSSLGKKFVDIMSASNLWIRTLSSSPVMEPEYRERFAERVRKAADQLEAGGRKAMGFGHGGMQFSRPGKRGVGNKSLEQGSKAVSELAMEMSAGEASQISKDLLFNAQFEKGKERAGKKEQKREK